jgi:heat shock protein HslJ/uncharacterized membrane protein
MLIQKQVFDLNFKNEKMKKIHAIYITMIVVFLQSCATSKTTINTVDVPGVYEGNIPCSDCEKIDYRLVLNADKSYKKTMVYKNKTAQPNIETGNYAVSPQGIITLSASKSQLQFTNKQLVLFKENGEKMKGNLTNKYLLKKIDTNNSTMPLLTAIFRAHGTEPFWGLEIKKEGEIYFSSVNQNNKSYKFSTATCKKMKEGQGSVYSAKSPEATIIVNIKKQKCVDSGSGETMDYVTEVNFQLNNNESSEVFKGCGFYIGDYRLNDIWALQTINGNALNKEKLSKGVPTMELNLSKNKVTGTASCNQYGGNISINNSEITFSNTFSTKMACPNMSIEDEFLTAISEQTLQFTLENGILTLKNGATVLTFKKVD